MTNYNKEINELHWDLKFSKILYLIFLCIIIVIEIVGLILYYCGVIQSVDKVAVAGFMGLVTSTALYASDNNRDIKKLLVIQQKEIEELQAEKIDNGDLTYDQDQE